MNISKVPDEEIKLFSSIAIEISAKCNRHCHFCPNSEFARPDEQMSTKMFGEIIADLRNLKYKGRVEFYIYNEPTRDKRLVDFIEFTRAQLPSACLMINTNGDYFKSAADIKKFFDAGLNQMQINIYSANDKYNEGKAFESGVRFAEARFNVIKGWVTQLELDQSTTLYQNIGAHKKACKVVKRFGVTKASKTIDGVTPLSNRSGNVPNFHEELKEPLKQHCTKPFRFLNINWQGQAILCCNDYYGETNMGNIKTHTLTEIWNHAAFNIYRLKLQNKDRGIFMCAGCDSHGGYYPHMINKVTHGKAKDAELLANDLTKRESIFKK